MLGFSLQLSRYLYIQIKFEYAVKGPPSRKWALLHTWHLTVRNHDEWAEAQPLVHEIKIYMAL